MSELGSAAERAKEHRAVRDRTKPKRIPTPALLVDLDCMETNLRSMAAFFRDTPAKLRPHFKTHQVLALAMRQLEAGAVGITCARLEHAEALVDYGITGILIASEIAGEAMVQRFAELSRRAPVIASTDSAKVVSDMARQAHGRPHELNLLVDLDLGLHRCGISPGEAVLELAKKILEKGMRFRGLMGYGGNLRLPHGPEKDQRTRAVLQKLVQMKFLLERNGIPVEIVSCGGTSDHSITATFPGVTESQAGSYLLMDTWYQPFAPEFQPALSVLATVISSASADRIVANAGVKAISAERGLPLIKGKQGLRVRALHAEHALIDVVDPLVSVDVGDEIEIWVQHLDSTISLHNQMYGVRNGEVVEFLRIER